MIGERDYSQRDIHQLLQRQLKLTSSGNKKEESSVSNDLLKSLTRVNLITRLLAGWSTRDDNLKGALIAAETSLLWAWHRIQLSEDAEKKDELLKSFLPLIETYLACAMGYFEKIRPHCYVRDGLSGYTGENAIFSLIVFEVIGLLASIGLAQIYACQTLENFQQTTADHANKIADALSNLIVNNPVSGSPRLDENSIDITLGMCLLTMLGREEDAINWLESLVGRVIHTLRTERDFPVDTDSIDDLVALDCGELDQENRTKLMNTSWLLPTLAAWCVIYDDQEGYDALKRLQNRDEGPEICFQLWHPNSDLFSNLYFQQAHHICGETEAPILLPQDMNEFRQRMQTLTDSTRHNVVDSSPAYENNFIALDLIACRHHRTPIAPFFWFQFAANS